jgi:hypothetical protein
VAQGDLTTLANVKGWFSPPLTTTTDDALLTRLITAASQFILTWLDRTLVQQSYSEARNGTGGTSLAFGNTPVSAVSALAIDGVAIPPAPDAVSPGYAFSATRLYLRGYAFTRGAQNVVLAYTAGYAATPPEVEQACIELVTLRYKERDRIGHVSKSLAGETVSFSQKDMSDDIKTLLSLYRRVAAP